MKRLILLTASMFVLAAPADGQEWTPVQQEVWDVEVACWEASATNDIMPCFHEDYVGWGAGSTVTTTKEQRRSGFTRQFEATERTFLQLIPVDIVVHGDMAVVMYVSSVTRRNRASGAEESATQRWTDILVRDGGAWTWISDHGVDITGAR